MNKLKLKQIGNKKYLTWLPTNARILKRYTGVGGSSSELAAKRNSVIMMPSYQAVYDKSINITESQSKLYSKDSIFGIYGGHNDVIELLSFLNDESIQYKKILMTMSNKSITVLLEAAKQYPELFSFNLLLDEVDQIVDDGNWRNDLELCYDLVKRWKQESYNKSQVTGSWNNCGTVTVISATGIDNILFEPISKLPLWVVEEESDVINFEVEIIESATLESSLASLLFDSESQNNFIFYNNVDGIQRIIHALNKPNECKIYCGDSSMKKAGKYYTRDTKSFSKYNFCTSAFFRAIDFNSDGEVFILTDPFSLHAGLTIEDIIQCAGRVRQNIKKVTIIMKTKEVKQNNLTIEKAREIFRDIANQSLGSVKTLASIGELTDTYLKNTESVRINLNGEYDVCYSWVEGKVKSLMFDKYAHESGANMLKLLQEYGYKGKVNQALSNKLEVISEKEDWSRQVEFVLNVIDTIKGSIIINTDFNDTQNLIFEGINKLGREMVESIKSKSEMQQKIKEYNTADRKAAVGLAVTKRLQGKNRISSKECKQIFKELFDLLGYEAAPKASLLKEFYNKVEETQWKEDGVKITGYNFSSPKYIITTKND